MASRSHLVLALAGGLLLGVAASVATSVWGEGAAGTAAPTRAGASSGQFSPAELARLEDVLDRLRREYVAPVDDQRLLEDALRGMVGGLDPYSEYLDADEYEEVRESAAGSYAGIGLEVSARDEGITVVRPLQDSPAQRAGVQPGDVIVRVDGRPVGPDVEAAIGQMRGPAGSAVELSLERGGELVDVAIERAHVELASVETRVLDPGVLYLRVRGFSDATPGELRRAFAAVDGASAWRGAVLDLRNNPGGVLESGVDVADAFLEAGVIVSARGRTADARFRMEARPGDVLRGAPLVVLVNGASASAAEIVAGALRDHRRAVLVGHRTFGKGSVQTIMPLPDGHALKLTTSHYATPSGTIIDGHGIEPDVPGVLPETPPVGAESGLRGLATETLLARDPDLRLALDLVQRRTRVAAATATAIAR